MIHQRYAKVMEPLNKAYKIIKKLEHELASVKATTAEPIAVVGMSCRFPEAENIDAFWALLRDGRDGIREVPPERWEIDAYYDEDADAPGKMFTRHGGFLNGIDLFDAGLFNISPREADLMDPQQRIMLEMSWAALEDAAISPDQLYGSETGVFVGVCGSDYGRMALQETDNLNAYLGTGNATSVVAGRIAYTFGFTGPCMSLDTACSSGLVALHYACESLRKGECQTALAGSVNLILAPEASISFSKAKMMAADGHCKTFDDRADGYVRSEGAAVLVLKSLSRAQRDGDAIYALIKSSHINQDGASGGLTVPNGPSQARLIRRALSKANVAAADIDYIEAHGTGTALGDPIEIGALAEVFNDSHSSGAPLRVGSVKAALGHLEIAAGMAGIVKVILAMRHQLIPANLHLQQLNHRIPWNEWPLEVPRKNIPWPSNGKPRLAGVSSFGFSGTNSHIIVQEAPPIELEDTDDQSPPCSLLCLSAKTEKALIALLAGYQAWLINRPITDPLQLAQLCWTANQGRAHFSYRVAIRATSGTELQQKVDTILPHSPQQLVPQDDNGIFAGKAPSADKPLAFLFSGQGAQYAGMGQELYTLHHGFRESIDQCEALLMQYLEIPLTKVLWGENRHLIDETAYAQPALFSLEYALAKLWLSWGLTPAYVMGHSVGEYAAACVAGVFSLADGLKLVAHRGRLMQALPKQGAMAVVLCAESEMADLLQGYEGCVSIAALNSPQQTVISGERDAVLALLKQLQARNIENKGLLDVSHAFHSPLMRPMLAAFKAVAAQIQYSPPAIDIVSNIEGRVDNSVFTQPDYWVEHIMATVNFSAGIDTLVANDVSIFLEVGPKATLLGLVRESHPDEEISAMACLRPARSDWTQLLSCLGSLYVNGHALDWNTAGVMNRSARKKLPLPAYPFQRQRHWFTIRQPSPAGANTPRFSGRIADHNGQTNGEQIVHPFLGQTLNAAVLPLTDGLYQCVFSKHYPNSIEHHQVYGKVVVPGAAYLEMALAAATCQFPNAAITLTNIAIRAALVLPEEGRTRVQTLLTDSGKTGYQFKIFSLPVTTGEDGAGTQPWQTHAVGEVTVVAKESTRWVRQVDTQPLFTRFAEQGTVLDVEEFYRDYARIGLKYGRDFKGIAALSRVSAAGQVANESLARIAVPASIAPELAAYHMHPALLDSCLQAVGAAFPRRNEDSAYLPVAVEKLHFYASLPAEFWCHVRLRDPSRETGPAQDNRRVLADLSLFTAQGQLLVAIDGLQAVHVHRSVLAQTGVSWKDKLYCVQWLPQPRGLAEADPGKVLTEAPTRLHEGETQQTASWLLLSDQRGVGAQLASLLEARRDRVLVVQAGDYASENHNFWSELLADDLSDDRLPPLAGIIHCWGIDVENSVPDFDPMAEQQVLCGSLISLVQTLMRTAEQRLPRLYIVSRNAQAMLEQGESVNLAQSTLWGFGRTLALEYPSLNCTCIDIDAGDTADVEQVYRLLTEIVEPDTEPQIAYRSGERYVARLGRTANSPSHHALEIPAAPRFHLRTTRYGALDQLALLPLAPAELAQDEVEIEVVSSALNFKDVLFCLGMLREYSERAGIMQACDQPLGFECSGRIRRVGSAVSCFKPGDAVFTMARSTMASHVIIDQRMVFSKPHNLSFAQAASLPTVFMTAIYSLQKLAKIKAGEKILIHAAAGGVGQAALQIARRVGATVFATASTAKWAHLKKQGVAHVMNSRNLDFAEELMQLTGGRGVDIVINSLSGDYIAKSADSLARGGRFIEIGKIGIWDKARMAAYRSDIDYHRFDLGEIDNNGKLQAVLLAEVFAGYEAGVFDPLPVTTYPIQQAQAAFRYLAQAKNIGKVVLTLPNTTETDGIVRRDASYLITGGLGALGLQVAETLIDQGAQALFLLGRSAPSDEAQARLDHWRNSGITIHVKAVDVADSAQVAHLFTELEQCEQPLAGIVHAAGVLDDGVVQRQSWQRFEKVMLPKVRGAWNLHQASRGLMLDFFVLFSSIASVIGAPGQVNYATANAFLDGLATYRKRLGLPASCINWGPWATVGMASAAGNAKRFSSLGLKRIPVADNLAIFCQLLTQSEAQVVVADVLWSKYLKTIPNATTAKFYTLLDEESTLESLEESGALLKKLMAQPQPHREAALREALRSQVASVIGLSSAERIDVHQPLQDLGIDSLMAVELINRMETALQCTLSGSLLFDFPTLQTLSEHIARNVLKITPACADFDFSDTQLKAREIERSTVTARDQSALSAMEEFFIETEGRRICVCRWGDAQATAVVIVHGILDHAGSWDAVAMGLFERGYQVVALDLRGHGRSSHNPEGIGTTVIDFLVDLTAVVKALELPSFTLIGHSIGSIVAGLYAGLYPQHLERLHLIEPVVPAMPEEHNALELLSNDLSYIQQAPVHPVYADLATAARTLTMSHKNLTQVRATKLARRITQSCEGGLRWSWDARLRNPMGIHLHVSQSHYLSVLNGLKVSGVRAYGTESPYKNGPLLLDPALQLAALGAVAVEGGHNLHTDNPQALIEALAGKSTESTRSEYV